MMNQTIHSLIGQLDTSFSMPTQKVEIKISSKKEKKMGEYIN